MPQVDNLNKYLTIGAMEGFLELIAPITAFSYVVKPGASAVNDVVRVPYATNNSASLAFSYSTGYATEGNSIVGKSVTLSNLLYQKINLSDSDLSVLNPESITRIGRQAGARLASDVISASFAATITAANFPSSGSADAAQYSGSAAIAALDKAVNDLKWPEGERFIIAGTTLWQAFMQNSTIVNASIFGSTGPVQNGVLSNVLGFTPYKVTTTLPNLDKGFAVNPNAILFANGYHAPQDSGPAYTAVDQMVDEKSGITIGFRQYYDASKATNVRVFDCMFGTAVGNSNALYHIK
jgi:hypothetical protein